MAENVERKVTHELNNILGVIVLQAEMILSKPEDPTMVKGAAEEILKAQERAAQLIRGRPDFKSLFEAVPGHYLVLLPDFTIVAVSDAYLRATMTHREEIVGHGLFDVFPDNPDDPNATGTSNLRASLNRVLSFKKTDVMAVQKYDIKDPNSPDGKFEERHWAPSNSPVLDSRGEVRYIIHCVEDVTEFVKLRQREKEIAERYRGRPASDGIESSDTALTSIVKILDESAILAITDRTGNIRHVNEKFCQISKYSREELIGQNHRILNSGHHPKEYFKEMWRTISSGKPWEGEIKNRAKDGSYYWVHTAISPILDDRGRPDQYVAIRYEITERKEGEERLNQTESQVRQLQKMDAVGRLAGGVAHDFNNLLGAINMYCDLLADPSSDPAAVATNVGEIRKAAERGAALTRQLLIFSRKQVVQLLPTDLNRVVLNIRTMLTRLIGENIEFVTHLEPDLRLVRVDPGQIEQVITNLVVNARDAMPKGGKVVVETANVVLDEQFTSTHLSVKPGKYVALTVTDTGCGMDATTQSKLFEPFFTTKPIGQGTGLGLTTAYGIIKQCQGTIWVYSEPGQGSAFKVYIPVTEETVSEVSQEPSRAIASQGTCTILLVEDDERLRRGFSEVLRRKGYEVITASDGQSALELCRGHRGTIHLLLTDMVMPGMSGLELARSVRALRADIRVLYMSGYTNETLSETAVEPGFQASFIQKPFDTKTLMNKIQSVLED